MHQKIIDYQRHTVEFSSITPTRTTPPITSRTTPRRPDQPYHTNPNPANPAESEPASKTSHNQTTTNKGSNPINPTRSTPTIKARTSLQKQPSENHPVISSPLHKKGTRRSLNTHQTIVKSCPNNPITGPPVLPPAHTHRASSREITLPQQHPPRKSRRRDTRSAHTMGQYCAWWVNTAVREPPLERQPPDGSGHRQIQRVSAPTVFFPRRTKAT